LAASAARDAEQGEQTDARHQSRARAEPARHMPADREHVECSAEDEVENARHEEDAREAQHHVDPTGHGNGQKRRDRLEPPLPIAGRSPLGRVVWRRREQPHPETRERAAQQAAQGPGARSGWGRLRQCERLQGEEEQQTDSRQ
jgi:hypothetical protein